jgi:hypothetical protein
VSNESLACEGLVAGSTYALLAIPLLLSALKRSGTRSASAGRAEIFAVSLGSPLAILEHILAVPAYTGNAILPFSFLYPFVFFRENLVASSTNALEAHMRGTIGGTNIANVCQWSAAVGTTTV